MAPTSNIVASDIYPAVRRFLLESGLARTLKAFNKETCLEGEEAGEPETAGPFAEADLVEACQFWLSARVASGEAGGKKKKRVAAELVDGDDVVEKIVPTEEETGTKQKKEKKQKKHNIDDQDISPMADASTDVVSKKKKKKEENDEGNRDEVPAAIEEEVVPKKKKKSAEPKQPGQFFQREDWSKWAENIKDENLKNNTYEATKLRVGASDTYGDKASEDLLKVKGKGFRKEMAKKKRASWRGGGELDQGIKSVPFPDSSDEE